jgi:hypothetical protein
VADVDQCPADREETANAYLLRNLPLDEASAFEEHYYNCPSCASVVERINYILAMKRAIERLRAPKAALRRGAGI